MGERGEWLRAMFSYELNTGPFGVNPLNTELNPICELLALLTNHFLHVSRIRVKSLTFRLIMSYIYIYIYIYMEHAFLMFLDHTRRRMTVGRTPLDEWSARRRELPDNKRHSQQTNIHAPVGIRTQDLSRWATCGRSPTEIVGFTFKLR
jgi:hypothetical protein